MKTTSQLKNHVLLAVLFLLVGSLAGCGTLQRYSQGSLARYVSQPIPELEVPIARTVSIDILDASPVSEARFYGHSTGGQTISLPDEVLHKMRSVISFDQPIAEEQVSEILEHVYQQWSSAREDAIASNAGLAPALRFEPGEADARQIEQLSLRAKEASENGKHTAAHAYHSAGLSHLQMLHAFDRYESAARVATAMVQLNSALVAAGDQIRAESIKSLTAWVENDSGAIGAAAPNGSHLQIYLISYVDAVPADMDIRQRIFASFVLVDGQSGMTRHVEGSDVTMCRDGCDRFKVNPAATPFSGETSSPEVKAAVFDSDGLVEVLKDGFGAAGSPYQYLLVRHGLANLARRAQDPSP